MLKKLVLVAPSKFADEAIDLVESIYYCPGRATALRALAPYLSDHSVPRALELAAEIIEIDSEENSYSGQEFASVLQCLAPKLGGDLLERAVELAEMVPDRVNKIGEELGSILPDKLLARLFRCGVKWAQAVHINHVKGVVEALGPYAQGESAKRELVIACGVLEGQDHPINLTSYYQEEADKRRLRRSLDRARGLRDPRSQFDALIELIPRSSGWGRISACRDALLAVSRILENKEAFELYSSLEPYIPKEVEREAADAIECRRNCHLYPLKQMEAARGMEGRARIEAFCKIARYAPGGYRAQALVEAVTAIGSLEDDPDWMTRKGLIPSLVPTLTKDSYPYLDDRSWLKAMAELVPQLSEDLTMAALDVVMAMDDRKFASRLFAFIQGYLPTWDNACQCPPALRAKMQSMFLTFACDCTLRRSQTEILEFLGSIDWSRKLFDDEIVEAIFVSLRRAAGIPLL